MSHYDCRDCGAEGGVAYGYCENCTPKEVLDLKKQLGDAITQATKQFDESVATAKAAFIDNAVEPIRVKLKTAYDNGKPSKQ